VSPSTDIGGSRLLTALAALLALSGCGSGQSSSTNYTQPTSMELPRFGGQFVVFVS
jgi:uncharacterized lipoprotein YmbA